jgi:hypothetical protein
MLITAEFEGLLNDGLCSCGTIGSDLLLHRG